MLAAAAALVFQAVPTAGPERQYPVTRTVDHVDTYFGTTVPDPYRWLEDDNAPETARWVEAQNAVTYAYLDKIPFRASLRARLEKLYDYARYTAPRRKGNRFFFSKNDGLQNQSVLYVQERLDGKPEVLLDPNTWSDDGTVRLGTFALSRDGRHAVYGISRSGSDWQEFKVLEIETKKPLADTLQWVKVSGAAWQGNGFYYSRYPAPAMGQERSSRNENHRVYYHRLGTPQGDDQLIYEDPANPQRFHTLSTTEDERFAILSISERGKGKDGNALFVRDLSKDEKTFTPLIETIGDDAFRVIDHVGGQLLVETNRAAPNGRVVRIDPNNAAEAAWVTVLAERPEPLQSAGTAGGKLFATYLKDVTTRASVHGMGGRLEHEVRLPGLGAASGFGGDREDTFVFFTYTSFDTPPTTYRYDISTRTSRLFRAPEIPGFDRTKSTRSRCSTRARTGRGCRCSSCTGRGSRSTAATRRCSTATAGSTSSRARRSTRCGWRCSSRASSTRRRTCAAVVNTASRGTRPA
jgi:prolyl oligopeptidase